MPKITRPEVPAVHVVIDGREVTAPKGTTVLQAARHNGIYIPHLCDFEGLTPFSGCRVCLVEIEGRRGLDTSCTIMASEGMVVHTATPLVKEMQRGVMEALLSEHPDRCLTCPREDRCPPDVICQRDNLVTDRCVLCPRNKQCELQRVVDFTGIRWNRLGEGRRPPKPERTNPFVERNESYCIYCARCVRVCDEVRGIFAFGLAYRGPFTRISVDFDKELKDSPCNFCGSCAVICPTGALIKRDSTYGRMGDNTVPSVCPFCGDGCGLYLNRHNGRLVNVSGATECPQNEGQLCVKGMFAYDHIYANDRLTSPLLRSGDGPLEPVSWDAALDHVANGLAAIRKASGPSSIGIIGSGHCSNEEAYLLQKLARGVIGTNNVDQIDRPLHTATVGTLLNVFGVAASTNPTSDIALAGCVLAIGSSTVESHEITALRIKKAVRNGGKLIVIDPRRTSLERFAYLYLQPRPGTDLALLNAMLKVLLEEQLYDKEYVAARCEGLDGIEESLRELDLKQVGAITGVQVEDMVAAARIFASGGADRRYTTPESWQGTLIDPGSHPDSQSSCIVYGTGVAQQAQAPAVVQALANLSALTGNLGRIGGGIHPRVGLPNLQGGLDMGLWSDLLPGQQPIGDPATVARLAERTGVEAPKERGLTLPEMLDAARQGKLRALYVVGANPLRTLPDPAHVRECLHKLDLLVVEELFPTEVTSLAHVVLPAAAVAEKGGTYTNLERRVQLFQPVVVAPGDSRPDWLIVSQLGGKLADHLGQRGAGFDYESPGDIFREIASVVEGYAGISYERLAEGGIQWPCREPADAGTDVLFADGFPTGKIALAAASYEGKDRQDGKFPIRLITGREIYHAHTGAMTRRAPRTAAFRTHARLEIHPRQAAELGLAHGASARILSANGDVSATVECNDAVPVGLAFLPIHYAECPVNSLFSWREDPRLPNVVNVRIEKA